ncbi:MAG: hypothetical protein LUD77_11395 [Clostridiales bacterium]|nr:hypothetical protein [Clostridiales bacterium]
MKNRLELHQILVDILGSENVYFQPPESVKLSYPCIIYNLNNINTRNADDRHYLLTNNYTITFISKDPDSEVPYSILGLPMCSFDRSYTADNLNHWVFNIYYKGGN